MIVRLPFLTGLLCLLLLASCGKEEGLHKVDRDAPKEDKTARTEAERGPVKVMVEVTPKEARLSDEPVLTLTIDAKEGVRVEKPPFCESLSAFAIRDFKEPLPEAKGDRKILRQIYTLEPMDTGELTVDPFQVTFVDERPDGDGKEHTVETEGLTIQVASALETEAPSLDDLRPAAGPMELPEKPGRAWVYALGGALVLGAALLLWRRFRKKKPLPPEKRLSPREIAYLEFQKLLEEGWIERDIKLFYVELTGIVRRFIERTTGIRAPEQTTEEFLRETSGGDHFPEEVKKRLSRFLEAADLVKFAALTPGKDEIEESFKRAKVFVGIEGEEGRP